MKTNEIEDGKILMIGDLVVGCIETDIVGEATYKILCKVTDINHYGDVSCEALKPFPDELDWQDGDDFSWIEPIPLTAEILEKNGFEKALDEDGTECYRYYNRAGDGYIKISLYNGGAGDWSIEIVNYEKFDNNEIVYNNNFIFLKVHQLQHALRLCGIDKTIEL